LLLVNLRKGRRFAPSCLCRGCPSQAQGKKPRPTNHMLRVAPVFFVGFGESGVGGERALANFSRIKCVGF
jgi:hypothetical protein